jgi:hypothetical protein
MNTFFRRRALLHFFAGAFISAGLVVPTAVSAHELSIDQGTSMLMHVEPNDFAVAKRPSALIFMSHAAVNCGCTITIFETGHQTTWPVRNITPTTLGADVRFEQAGIATVQLAGTQGGRAFLLHFEANVVSDDLEARRTTQTGLMVLIALGSAGALSFILWLNWRIRARA